MQTPDAVTPPPGNPRFELLDSLRAVAALGVLASHVGYLAGTPPTWYGGPIAQGIAGVTVFFVLSGFLLYRPFLSAALDRTTPIRLGDYARRRLLRIVPAYWLALAVIGVWLDLPGVFDHDWWRIWFFGQVYSSQTLLAGLGAAWTLCIEITFYALLPFYAYVMARICRGRAREQRLRIELWALAALAAVSLLFRYETLHGPHLSLYSTLPPYFGWFAVGMAMAVLSVGPVGSRLVAALGAHPVRCWAAALVGYVMVSYLLRGAFHHALFYSTAQWMFQHVISAAIAFALVAPAVFGDHVGGWPRRVLAWRWLSYLGLISYGIYLWQGAWVEQVARWAPGWGIPSWMPPFVIEVVAVIALSIACAAISYHLFERPIMRFKNTRRSTKPPVIRDPVSSPAPH